MLHVVFFDSNCLEIITVYGENESIAVHFHPTQVPQPPFKFQFTTNYLSFSDNFILRSFQSVTLDLKYWTTHIDY